MPSPATRPGQARRSLIAGQRPWRRPSLAELPSCCSRRGPRPPLPSPLTSWPRREARMWEAAETFSLPSSACPRPPRPRRPRRARPLRRRPPVRAPPARVSSVIEAHEFVSLPELWSSCSFRSPIVVFVVWFLMVGGCWVYFVHWVVGSCVGS